MKTIENKKTGIKEKAIKFGGSETKEVDYKDLINISLDIIPQGGFNVSDVEKRLRIKSQLKSIKDNKIKLEDSDYQSLVTIVKNSRWPYYDEELGEFLSTFK